MTVLPEAISWPYVPISLSLSSIPHYYAYRYAYREDEDRLSFHLRLLTALDRFCPF